MKLEGFIDYLSIEKRYSKHTLIAYSNDLEQFENYVKNEFEGIKEREVNAQMIREWLVWLKEKGLGARSISRKIASLRRYFHYLITQGEIEQNPMLKILPPKGAKRNPVFVMEDDMEKILDLEYEDSFLGRRDELILEFLYATGVRRAELIEIEEKDIDWSGNVIRIFGKRRKERILPLHSKLIEKLKSYCIEKESLGIKETKLFVDKENKAISQYQLYYIVCKYLKIAQVEKKSPHVLRHTFATHLLNEGADIMNVKELLGHANLDATQVYTHNTIEKLKNVYKLAHPRAEN